MFNMIFRKELRQLTLGERLKKLRQKKTQQEVAESIGISRARYSHYENDRSEPDNDLLQKLSDYYGVSTDYLLTGKETGPLILFENESGTFEDSRSIRLANRLKRVLKYKGLSIEDLSIKSDVSIETINDFLDPNSPLYPKQFDSVERISVILDAPSDYLLGLNNDYEVVIKNEKDIAKRLEQFKEEIENSDGLAFSGEPLSDEAKESLIESMEHIFRQTQRINKKYTPKKFRDDE